MAGTDTMHSQGRGEIGRALTVQYIMTKNGDTTIAHIQELAVQRPADAWITTTALHFIVVLRALKSRETPRNPQQYIVGHKHDA